RSCGCTIFRFSENDGTGGDTLYIHVAARVRMASRIGLRTVRNRHHRAVSLNESTASPKTSSYNSHVSISSTSQNTVGKRGRCVAGLDGDVIEVKDELAKGAIVDGVQTCDLVARHELDEILRFHRLDTSIDRRDCSGHARN